MELMPNEILDYIFGFVLSPCDHIPQPLYQSHNYVVCIWVCKLWRRLLLAKEIICGTWDKRPYCSASGMLNLRSWEAKRDPIHQSCACIDAIANRDWKLFDWLVDHNFTFTSAIWRCAFDVQADTRILEMIWSRHPTIPDLAAVQANASSLCWMAQKTPSLSVKAVYNKNSTFFIQDAVDRGDGEKIKLLESEDIDFDTRIIASKEDRVQEIGRWWSGAKNGVENGTIPKN